jgi:hypothetical protein
VGTIIVIWLLWLCTNDNVFNDKNASRMQVIYRCTTMCRSWSPLQRVEHRKLFMGIFKPLDHMARNVFSNMGQHNLRIGPPSPMALPYLFLCLLQRLNYFYSVAFGSQGRVHPNHAEPGCKV